MGERDILIEPKTCKQRDRENNEQRHYMRRKADRREVRGERQGYIYQVMTYDKIVQ